MAMMMVMMMAMNKVDGRIGRVFDTDWEGVQKDGDRMGDGGLGWAWAPGI